jgi:hypothetical protein
MDYYEFKTSPPDGRFKLLVGSDWHFGAGEGQAKGNFLKLYPDMLNFDPDVVFITGDNVQVDNRMLSELPGIYQEMFDTAKKLFATAILAPVPGNHDWANPDPKLDFYVEQFYLPENGEQNQKERTYSFNYGNVHFVAENYGMSDNWLEQDLVFARGDGAEFVIAGRHSPPIWILREIANLIIKGQEMSCMMSMM